MKQVILPFLPGYMFDGRQLKSTGAALRPTQHISKKTGEVMYYCVPVFRDGDQKIGLYIRHQGIVDWLANKCPEDQ